MFATFYLMLFRMEMLSNIVTLLHYDNCSFNLSKKNNVIDGISKCIAVSLLLNNILTINLHIKFYKDICTAE